MAVISSLYDLGSWRRNPNIVFVCNDIAYDLIFDNMLHIYDYVCDLTLALIQSKALSIALWRSINRLWNKSILFHHEFAIFVNVSWLWSFSVSSMVSAISVIILQSSSHSSFSATQILVSENEGQVYLDQARDFFNCKINYRWWRKAYMNFIYNGRVIFRNLFESCPNPYIYNWLDIHTLDPFDYS